MSGRMIFPFEELPEDERGEFAYQEVWPYSEVWPYTWGMSKYFQPKELRYEPYVISTGGDVASKSKLLGSMMVVDFADGRRSVGTLTDIGVVTSDGGDVVLCEVSYRQKYVVGEQPPKVPKRTVHRASRGLRPPESAETRYRTFMDRVLKMRAGRMEKMW